MSNYLPIRSIDHAAADASQKKNEGLSPATETDPLLIGGTGGRNGNRPEELLPGSSGSTNHPGIRARRTSSRSPITTTATVTNNNPQFTFQSPMLRNNANGQRDVALDGYEAIEDATIQSRASQAPADETFMPQISSTPSQQTSSSSATPQPPPSVPLYRTVSQSDNRSISSASQPPLLEIPEEIYAVRKSALQVLKPLTKTWVVISVGFALTVLFGTARWTRLIPGLPFWFILLPCWSAHVGLLWLHVLSAQALSAFIAEANESRQRPDSRDHLNRTEYLPLLQRSLKFGLKTGLLSFFIFAFEILIYVRFARGSISLSAAFTPLWILVMSGILDGLICKTQHFLRVICWVLLFAAMVLTVLKVDYRYDSIRWRVVVSPVVAVLSVASATLIYIVYGHQVGYYRLTESQLTAGNLYSLAALVCIVLVVMIGEVIPLSRPVEIETRLFVVILAPLVICLVGMGAWVVSRDEFARLLLYGGQAAVHPMKLRWEAKGWTSVQGKGVIVVPMFGEVTFQPLERKPAQRVVELCACCSGACYPYEEEDEETHITEDLAYHPYLDPSQCRSSYSVLRGL